jgi:hypothetical protein
MVKRQMPELNAESEIIVRLTRAEALVLFECLARETDVNKESSTVHLSHPAEETVLWAVERQLQTWLTEVCQPDYKDLVRVAREAIVREGSGRP